MNKLLSLIKIDLIHSYSINKLSKKHNKNRKLGSLIATLLLGGFLLIMVSFLIVGMGMVCKETNQLDFLLVFSYTIGSFLCFTITISKAHGLLFESKDFELLMSMPLKTNVIVLSKLISLLILNYLGFGLICVPGFIVYGILASKGILFYLVALLTIITGPLLIVTICSFISYLLVIILKRFKSKSIIMSVLSLGIFLLVFVVYMTVITKVEMVGANGESMEEIMAIFEEMLKGYKNSMETYYPISKFLSRGLSGNVLYYFIYLALMIVPFSGFVVFVGKNYLNANMNAKNSQSKTKFTLKEQKQSSKILAIIKRDCKRFFSSSAQVLNIGIGPILSTILTVVMLINFKNSAGETEEDIEFMNSFLPILLTMLAGFSFGIMPSTSSSISLEGKNFWILKSSPIKEKDIFIAKIMFYVLISTPFAIINSTILFIVVDCSIIDVLLSLLSQIVIIYAYATEGLWINILTPKFDWDNEVKAIKQGTGPLLAMLFGFALGIVLYVPPFIAFSIGLNGMLVLLIAAIIVSVLLSVILFTHGKKKYQAIQI